MSIRSKFSAKILAGVLGLAVAASTGAAFAKSPSSSTSAKVTTTAATSIAHKAHRLHVVRHESHKRLAHRVTSKAVAAKTHLVKSPVAKQRIAHRVGPQRHAAIGKTTIVR